MKLLCTPQVAGMLTLAATLVVAGLAQASTRESAQAASTTLDGWRIAYEARGHGDPALVFVHGASSSRKAWRKQLESLDVDRQLIAVDLLGHGDSEAPETAYTMELFARGVAAVLDAEQIDCAVLIGHSNGVPVVRQVYRMFPRRVAGLMAVDGAFRNTISPEMEGWMRDAFERPDFEDFRAQMATQMPMVSLSEPDIALIRDDMMATPKHVMQGSLEAFVDPEIWGDDPVEVPLFVLLAQQPTWTPEYIEYVRGIGPEVEVTTWEEVSHFLFLERPEAFNELVTAFVAHLPGC